MTQDPNSGRINGTFLQQLWDPRVSRVVTTLVGFVAFFAFCRAARETITLFLFAVLFAYFLAPLVNRLARPLRGRGKAILLVYAVGIGLLIAIGFIAGPAVGTEGKQLATSLPTLLDKIGSGQLVVEFGQQHHLRPAVVAQVQSFLRSHREAILNYGKEIGARLATPISHIWWLFIIPILSLFFLKQGFQIADDAVELGRSRKERSMIRGLLSDINVMLGSYIRSQIILAILTLCAFLLVLNLMRVPYAFFLSPLGGFLEFIPVVGPAVAAVGIVVIAALSGYGHVLWLVLFLGCWRIVQDYVNAPRIMGKSVEINPLLQIFAVLAGGEIDGVVGALVAVPAVATLRIFARRLSGQNNDSATDSLTEPVDTVHQGAPQAGLVRQ